MSLLDSRVATIKEYDAIVIGVRTKYGMIAIQKECVLWIYGELVNIVLISDERMRVLMSDEPLLLLLRELGISFFFLTGCRFCLRFSWLDVFQQHSNALPIYKARQVYGALTATTV